MGNFNHERFGVCAMTNRFSRVCMEEALRFANKRKTFGKTLVEHPVIRWKLAEMIRQIEATHHWIEGIASQRMCTTYLPLTCKYAFVVRKAAQQLEFRAFITAFSSISRVISMV